MILPPAVMRLYIAEGGKKKISIWLPIIIAWPLILALLIILAPIGIIASYIYFRSIRTALLLGPRILTTICALRGLKVNVADADSKVRIYFA